MTHVNIAEARANLSQWIERAMRGEDVVIAKYGKPVVALRAVQPPKPMRSPQEWVQWMRERRDARPGVSMTSVELLNSMYDDNDRT